MYTQYNIEKGWFLIQQLPLASSRSASNLERLAQELKAFDMKENERVQNI